MWRQVEGEWQTVEGLNAEKGVSGKAWVVCRKLKQMGGAGKGRVGKRRGKMGV